MDYHKREKNIPHDIKVDIPKISSRKERGYINNKENGVHGSANEKSSKLSKRTTIK